MNRRFSTSGKIDAAAARWIARRDLGLSTAEETELARWREQDPRHADALARFEATWLTLGRPRRAGAAAGLACELGRLKVRQRRRRIGAVSTALAALAVAIGLWWSPLAREASLTTTPSLLVQLPERRTLPDGSIVELKPDATIAVDFRGPLRRVRLLSGEAHFEVAKDPSRTFVVEAGGVEVRAVGTAFAVLLRPAGVEVLVTEGRVAVNQPETHAPNGTHEETSAGGSNLLALVDAGSRVVVEPLSHGILPLVIPIVPEELAERQAWRRPRVEFSGTPLADVVVILNRHNATRFIIEDQALARVPLSGLFRVDDPVLFTRMLEAGFGIKAEARGTGEIVLRRVR